MPTLLPTADVNVSEWFNDESGSTVWDHLAGGHHVELGRRMVRGPIRVLFFTTDDGARYPMDHVATITNCVDGSRVGQLARQQTKNRIIDHATNFVNCRTDHSPCSPGRAAFMCGLRSMNH